MYRALRSFTDLQDNNYKYREGDEFPRRGMKVSKARLNELLTTNNRRHLQMIEEIEEPKTEKPKKVEKKTVAKTEKKATKSVKRTVKRNK